MNSAVALARSNRIAELRLLDRKVVEGRQPVTSEEEMLMGKKVTFTTFIEQQSDGRLLVLVRSDEKRFFGLVSSGATDGFWFLAAGAIAEVTDQDVLEFFS